MSEKNNMGHILLGTVIGVGLGILFAPDRGSTTRKKISANAASLKDNVSSETKQLKDSMVKKTGSLKNSVTNSIVNSKESLEDKLEMIVSDASYKTEEIIEKLEHQLQAMKLKNQKLRSGKAV